MNRKDLLKEISYGVFTLLIFLVIFILYFSRLDIGYMFQNNCPEDISVQEIPEGYIPSTDVIINNASCELIWPFERTIVLRMDDVQSFSWANISMNMTDTVLQMNKSIVLGVIPGRLVERKNGINAMADYLLSKTSDSRMEVAVHGDYHIEKEFDISEDEAYLSAKDGISKIENAIHIIPTTFIPPNNVLSPEAKESISKLGIYIVSGEQNYFRYEHGVYEIGYSAKTKNSDYSELNPVEDVIRECNESLRFRNLCVIMMHPQDYVSSDGVTMNQTRYVELIRLLDGLDALNANYTTFNSMLSCQNVNSTLQLTKSTYGE